MTDGPTFARALLFTALVAMFGIVAWPAGADEPIADVPGDEQAADSAETPRDEKAEPSGRRRSATTEKSLDEQLLEGLSDDLMDDLDDLAPPRPTSGDQRGHSDLDEQLLEGLDAPHADAAGDENPLDEISRRMRDVEQMLRESDTGERPQSLQRKIVADLDKLIDAAMRRAQSSNQASSQSQQRSRRDQARQPGSMTDTGQPGKQPARDSTDRLGTAQPERPTPAEMAKLLEDLWGHLPERDRQRVINSSIEEFLPAYEQLIEQYFRRLAEELDDRR